ncbi:MAG TPA: DUF3857 domain-containing protein [Myxococcales bacterium]|nr:DUF3857 domain-containing protein [Myxococcales bacterium]
MLTTLLALVAVAPAAAPPEFSVGPPPSWVKEAELPPPAASGGDGDAVSWLLEDEQVFIFRGIGEERFRHEQRLVRTTAGVHEMSEIQIGFDPAYQRLTIHGVWLHRAGARLAAFSPGEVKVIQQESELEQRLYNGQRTAIIFVQGVRAGDVIDYSYTLAGDNPVFAGQFNDQVPLAWPVPVSRLRYRLLFPKDRPVRVKAESDHQEPKLGRQGMLVEYTWDLKEPRPVLREDGAPPWHDALPTVQVADDWSWGAVAKWAAALMQDRALSPDMQARVDGWKRAEKSQAGRFLLALRFVQDEVRYLGIELGPNSHRPHSPQVVFAQRFGDCKDKSLLLVTLARALGLEADVALVSTRLRHTLDDRLPAGNIFDHAIVRAVVDGKPRWVDPTRSLERGSLESLESPPFERALLARPDTTGLTEIPAPEGKGNRRVEMRYVVTADGQADLRIQTTCSGREADQQRAMETGSSREEIERARTNFLAHWYPDISVKASRAVEDDPEKNVLRATEAFHIPDFWKKGRGVVSSWPIQAVLDEPAISLRRAPLVIDHPTRVEQIIDVEFPDSQGHHSDSEEVTGPAAAFEVKVEGSGRHAHLELRYRTTANEVSVMDVPKHLEMNRKIGEWSLYNFTTERAGGGDEPVPTVVWVLVGGLAGVVILGAVVVRKLGDDPVGDYRKRRRKKSFSSKFQVQPGEAPASAILARGLAEVVELSGRLPCECGARVRPPEQVDPKRGFILGGELIVPVDLSCPRCSKARKAYFKIAEG